MNNRFFVGKVETVISCNKIIIKSKSDISQPTINFMIDNYNLEPFELTEEEYDLLQPIIISIMKRIGIFKNITL